MQVHTDCRHFDGYKPCRPHKVHGVHCANCSDYERVSQRILIIKTGAAGEVIRCTPLLAHIRSHDPQARVVWLTDFPELVPESHVDAIMRFDWRSAEWAKAQHWNMVLSLDKDVTTCALARQLTTTQLKGFSLNDCGHIVPADEHAEHKWRTGIFDDLMKSNRKHYLQEIFDICDWRYDGQRYILPAARPTMLNPMPGTGPIIGLNTGAGKLWPTRIWPEQFFEQLIHALHKLRMRVALLGGPEEHDRNARLARVTGCTYHGIKPLREFLTVVDACDVVMTAVTMALHMAIGLNKRIVLLNNIFNKHEFHLFELGEIIEPPLTCLGCYKAQYDENCPVPNCMKEISVQQVTAAIQRQVGLISLLHDVPLQT